MEGGKTKVRGAMKIKSIILSEIVVYTSTEIRPDFQLDSFE